MAASTAHDCPAPGCTVSVPRDRLACPRHWYSIPLPLRNDLWRAYRDDGMWSASHLAAMDACVDFLEAHGQEPHP